MTFDLQAEIERRTGVTVTHLVHTPESSRVWKIAGQDRGTTTFTTKAGLGIGFITSNGSHKSIGIQKKANDENPLNYIDRLCDMIVRLSQ